MELHRVKSVNHDKRSNKRIRFASAKERSKKASADVYRTFDRGSSSNGIQGAGLTSAATRESHVHNPRQDDRAKKRQRKHHKTIDSNITSGKTRRDDVQEDVGGNDLQGLGGVRTLVEDLPLEKEIISSMTTFASELDVAVDRNASEIFSGYHRKVWRLVRSLPEILHNVEEIIDIHLAYMLSPSSDPETVSSRLLLQRETTDERLGFVVNHATTDILHLLAVLARDLRHEIHPYLHTKIIPRIVYDLLNPPPPPPESERQPIPVDVTIVEAAFRSLSYIFRYDLQNVVDEMELMRKYYGVTLGNRRELVRRLSAETFAPLIRKLKGRKEVERHIRRVLTALSSTGVPDTSNRQLIRSQADAVDGISQLFFLLVRGPVRGTFYSQGDSTFEFILACICGEGLRGKESRLKDPDVDERNEKDPNNYDLVFEVGYSILSSLCRHFDASTISAVSQILFETVKKSVASYSDALETCTATMSKTVVVPIISGIKLVVRLLSFQSGSLLQHLYANQLKPFDEYVQRLCSETFIGSLREKSDHGDVVSLICQVLAYSQTTGTMSIHAVDFVRNMLKVKDLPTQQLYSRSLVLTKELLPQMQVKSERISAIVLLLDAAARVIQNSKRDGIEILFAVVSNTQSHEKCFQGVDFPIFGVNGQERLDLSQTTSKTLMGAVLEDVVDEFKAADEAGLAFLAVKVRCVPFLLLMNKNGSDELKLHKRIISWLSKLLELPKLFCSSLSQDQVIAQALVVEATATVLVMISDELDAATVLTAAKKTTNAASKLLLDHCSSPWTVRAAASLIPVLEKFSLNLTDYPNKVFECVIPNLESPNHFLRLYTLKILCTFPKIPFVVDHAELDLQGDLDEEPSNPAIAGSSTSNSPGPVGPCDILDTLLLLESSPVSLHGERQLLGLISKVEILARTGRLPVVYVEAAACHMLGIMNLKFAPVWPAAKSAVATLVTTHEKIVWPFLEAKLKEVMTSPSEVSETAVENKDFCFQQRQKSEDHDHTNTETFFDVHLNMCRSWESSNGTNVELAGTSLLTEEDVVPCFHVTDPETVMEFVWKVAEMKQNVFAHHSRVLVPVFLGFLHNQYFDQHSDDQDALELCLDLHVEQEQSLHLKGFVLQKRLKAFLMAFAAVEGPKQLVHHKVLEAIYRAFLGHQDPTVADLALSCILTFKLDYLQPHADLVKEILKKGNFRGALLKLGENLDKVPQKSDQYKALVPVLSRVLFGRVTSSSRKSAKDSPKARRAAVLSFLSVLCKDNEDLSLFLYLMTRSFLPKKYQREPIETLTAAKRDNILLSLLQVTSADVGMLSSRVIEGFLHLLENVISQWGHRIIAWVPAFTRIVVETCNLVAVSSDVETSTLRGGAIRSLGFQRLGEMLSIFGTQVDFSKYFDSFWSHIAGSLEVLPEMSISNEGCPALLTLLQTMTNESSLISMLVAHDEAIVAIIKCISGSSPEPVISASLSSVENLLAVTNKDSQALGRESVNKHKMLLMQQFTARLGSGSESKSSQARALASTSKKPSTRSRTWKRELEVLMKISELLEGDTKVEGDYEEFAFSLCNLLLPFIHQVPWVVDEDKSNILSVIEPITRLLTVEESKQFYYNVADSLAPGKAGSGIKSLAVRRSIAAVLKNVAEVDNHMAVVATAVVKLCSIHPKLVDEMDFDTVIPQLNALGDESKAGFWGSMRSTKAFDPLILTPIINVCFNLLYSDDGVITRSSFNVLRALILVTSQQSGATASVISQWDKMIESVVVPMIKTGLQARNLQVRRYCILLLRVTTHGFFERQSSGLCGDLICLYDDENHDLDFFLSITHVQIHRRARSFQRLRKTLSLLKDGKIIPPIGQQSMSGFLLPLALHPIFESKSKTEEAFALDAIATVGAISRTLSWSKYNTTLWTLLNQFDRHPGQQKYMIGALCAMFDGFHFELVVAREAPDTDDAICKTSVWGALENRIIPKVEDLLVKESADRHGNKVKTLRPTIVLALLKLFQKFPRSFLEERLPRLLAVVCNALCNKDSSARDLARTTLAKMVVSMDLSYLPDVIRELAITLNEGYKLHVRAATVHSILLELSNVYEPILSSSPDGEMPVLLPFDDCVPALMDLIQQDLFGEANERRESSETNVRYVKEAGGSKSIHSVELISRMVCFTPSMVKTNGSSGVHGIVSPLLQRLQIQTIDAKTIKKVREILTRAIVGFSNNKSMTTDELLPFVFATLHPFTGSPNFQRSLDSASGDEYSVDENGYKPIKVSGSNRKDTTVSGPTTVKASVAAWQPSTLSSASSSRAAAELRREEGRKLRRVLDGASAPKLTGTMRHGTIDAIDSNIVNDPSAITAITFGLSLLNSSMKKVDLSNKKQLAPAINPFIPMLTSIVCHCRQTEVILLSLKCLTIIFEMHLDLPSTPSCSKSIGKQALSLLTSSGASMDKNRELLQACFRILTFLIDADSLSSNNSQRGEDTLSQSETLPLDQEQMKVLISLVQLSITDSDQHNPAIGLVKALMSRKFVSPEFYDLMESICKEVARSSKANLRQICSTIFVRFLLDYPMSEEKLEHHIKQVVANISYEYEDGRLSSQMMLFSVLEKLPNELIERHAQMFFLPLVLQLVNDESKQCRERVKKCVILLLTRSTMRTLQSFHAYCSRWSKEDGPLKVASLQIFGLVIESRGDFVRANQVDRELGLRILQNLQERTDSDWEVSYFSLLCVEKITQSTEGYFLDHADLMSRIVDCMMDAHPWIRLSSTRIISSIVASKYAIQILADQNGTLFQIVQQMCSQLNAKEDEYSEELSHISIKTLCTIVPLMATHSSLCYRRLAEEEEDQEEDESGKDPVFWMMRRLSQMCKNKGKKRRIGIFKLYAALSMQHFSIVGSHIELMLEGLHRSIVEATNEAETKAASDKRQKAPSASSSRGISTGNDEMTEHEIAENVLRQLEDICSSPDDFLKAYASVKRRAREKKMKRKSEEKAEAVKNPQAAVERTARKHGREKMRRKRRAEEHRSARGGEKKTRQSYI